MNRFINLVKDLLSSKKETLANPFRLHENDWIRLSDPRIDVQVYGILRSEITDSNGIRVGSLHYFHCFDHETTRNIDLVTVVTEDENGNTWKWFSVTTLPRNRISFEGHLPRMFRYKEQVWISKDKRVSIPVWREGVKFSMPPMETYSCFNQNFLIWIPIDETEKPVFGQACISQVLVVKG